MSLVTLVLTDQSFFSIELTINRHLLHICVSVSAIFQKCLTQRAASTCWFVITGFLTQYVKRGLASKIICQDSTLMLYHTAKVLALANWVMPAKFDSRWISLKRKLRFSLKMSIENAE